MSEVKRRLATILATDCVDFSKHMESQEEKTLSSLKKCRDIIDPIINKFSGRIFHTAGDSIIAEFDSPVGATKAGVEFQKSIKDRNLTEDKNPKLSWRVGIHLDDIIIEGDNIYGNGVNIAARLESQSPVGEILISDVVRQQIYNKINSPLICLKTRSKAKIISYFDKEVVSYVKINMEIKFEDTKFQVLKTIPVTDIEDYFRFNKHKIYV